LNSEAGLENLSHHTPHELFLSKLYKKNAVAPGLRKSRYPYHVKIEAGWA
jgi:hypothetical protein